MDFYCFFLSICWGVNEKWEIPNLNMKPTFCQYRERTSSSRIHWIRGPCSKQVCVNPSYTGRGTEVTAQRRGFCGGTDISEDAHWCTCDETVASTYHLLVNSYFLDIMARWPSQKPPKSLTATGLPGNYPTTLKSSQLASTTSGLSSVCVCHYGQSGPTQVWVGLPMEPLSFVKYT